MHIEQLGYGRGHICVGSLQRSWHLSKLTAWGTLLHIFSLVDGNDPTSVPQAQNQRCLFLSCYIQREETVPPNVELLSIFGSLAIFKVLHLDLKTKLIGYRFLSSFAQTLFWEQIHHPSRISEQTGCFHSCSRNGHPERLISYAPVIPY